jgi:N-succinyldiaminopimelate aminotransferase
MEKRTRPRLVSPPGKTRGVLSNRIPPLTGHPVFAELPETVFEAMSRLARQHGAINLGQLWIEVETLVVPVVGGDGRAERGQPHHRRVLVADALLVRPGDEVVLFEPMYDAYLPLVRRAGGVPRFVTLKPPHFRIESQTATASKRRQNAASRARSSSSKTVALGLSGLLSRTIRVRSETAFCRRFDAVAVCDEVWEHVIFDGRRHRPLMAQPGMRERTVK